VAVVPHPCGSGWIARRTITIGLKDFVMTHDTREAWPTVFRLPSEHLERMAMPHADAPR
jgi:hypothetical protein